MGRNVTCGHPDRKHFAKGMCRRCYHSDYMKRRYAQDPDFRIYHRERHLQSAYRMSIEDYDKMLKNQGGKCKLCGAIPNRPGNSFGVDHDHKTNRNRGILCKFCNSKLGWFENRRELIMEYIG